MDGCLDMPPKQQQACYAQCRAECPPAPPPAPPVLELVSMDPDSLALTVLTTDHAGDLLSSGIFGVIGNGKYYTLVQPPGAAHIHLASFDLSSFEKTVVPMPVTVAEGGVVDGVLVGTDADESACHPRR